MSGPAPARFSFSPTRPRRAWTIALRLDRRRRRLALSAFHPRRMGGVARRHRTDPDHRRSAQAAVDPRSDLARRSGGDLPAAFAPARALRRGDPGAVQGDAAISRRHRRQGALHHRRRRFGGGGQVDDGARAAGAADALAQHAQGRTGDDRRVPASQRAAHSRRADGPQGLSRELRRHRR